MRRQNQRRPYKRRNKIFGHPAPRCLDREARLRLMTRARALCHGTREKGRHWGSISAKTLRVFEVLLFAFANGKTGLCFPSYESIAQKCGCARSTVALAIAALEKAGLLTWRHRIRRVRIDGRVRVWRTSNAYAFPVISSKSDGRTGSGIQDSSLIDRKPTPAPVETNPRLEAVLRRLQEGVAKATG